MQTRIVIEHTDATALKSHPLWDQIMALMFADGPVSVVEIEQVETSQQPE